jgi:hypothetical protein
MPPCSQGRPLIFALLRVIPPRPDDIIPITPFEDTRAAANPPHGAEVRCQRKPLHQF